MSLSIRRSMRNVSDKICSENKKKKNIFCSIIFFSENHAVYEIMWKNILEPAIWRMRIACWLPEATNTHSECVVLIPFPQHQWLHERASTQLTSSSRTAA